MQGVASGSANIVEEQSLRLFCSHDMPHSGESAAIDLVGSWLPTECSKARISPCSFRHTTGGTLQPPRLLSAYNPSVERWHDERSSRQDAKSLVSGR